MAAGAFRRYRLERAEWREDALMGSGSGTLQIEVID
jgi:hypothetical protein